MQGGHDPPLETEPEKEGQSKNVDAACTDGKRGVVMTNEKYMEEWTQICGSYCKKADVELLFVNIDNFGVQYRDGTVRHIYAEELAQILSAEKSSEISMEGKCKDGN